MSNNCVPITNPLIDSILAEKDWLKKSLSILAYHISQQAKHENVRTKKWKLSNTAFVLKMSIGYISESIKLAKMSKKINLEGLTREKALETIKSWTDLDSI